MTTTPVNPARVQRISSARLPTKHGEFIVHVYQAADHPDEHVVIVKGEVAGKPEVLLRMHSECFTGDILGSLRCDCGEQLALALERIEAEGGIVIYLRGHEGRGIGLGQKLRAYALQDKGLDTVEANLALGLPIDSRRFDAAADILHDLGVRSVRLMSNNPFKVAALHELGIEVVAREGHEVESNEESGRYLKTKREKLGHQLHMLP
ncbi:GTP cyclohydrolase II [Roseateles sp. DAIF2]|uniref:GTP cyclohydrolase II n=1 Tax=Roseateles sp. DAIF2 TaxID=2714952 RepID=UPI0018A266C6|nr:GTP cyclohydrolase II [Roseateles sp. DAIF2]QPF75384.1 GTP cyclohydrolase II [Roseateles sp. DAIF2]